MRGRAHPSFGMTPTFLIFFLIFAPGEEHRLPVNKMGLPRRCRPPCRFTLLLRPDQKVPNALSRQTKRRTGARGRAHPSFDMTPTF